MNAKYFAALITIILVTGLSQSVTHAQTLESVLTSKLNDVLVQRSPKSHSQLKDSEPPSPPDRGAPSGRKGGATHNARIWHRFRQRNV